MELIISIENFNGESGPSVQNEANSNVSVRKGTKLGVIEILDEQDIQTHSVLFFELMYLTLRKF